MSDHIIRPLTRADEAEWRRLWTLYLEFYETSVKEEVYATTFERLLSGDEHEFHGLVLENPGGGLAGLTHYLLHRVVYLPDLFVDKSVRGTGGGRALIEAVYAAADAAGCPSVYWLTQEFNYTGRMLYDRIGTRTPFIRYNR